MYFKCFNSITTRLIFLLVLLATVDVKAQFYSNWYRPDVRWMELKTPHFQILYPNGADSSAFRAGQILEAKFSEVKNYLPSSKLDDLPVILNDYNDRSNGFVTTLNFRMEVQLTPIKGKDLNPRTGGWLENVLPHELVHAMHFEVTPKGNLFTLLKPFSPDGIRSLHTAAPAGILEGVAVDFETHGVAPHGGRGQYPYFTNQFNSVFQSGEPWTLPQMTFIPSVSRPFVRHYMGGYEFMHWLQETYGREVTIEAIENHFKRPFFFFGHALKRTTDKKSSELYDAFSDYKREQLKKEQGKISYTPLKISGKGQSLRRPKWLNDDTLLFYGSFYNKRPGFYSYSLENEKLEHIRSISITEDFRYHLDRAAHTITYGSYHADLIYDDVFKADLFETDIATGKTKRLTSNKKLYAPTKIEDQLWAIQAEGSYANWVKFNKNNIEPVSPDSITGQIIAVEPNPNPDPNRTEQAAVVINKNGVQALWITTTENAAAELSNAPDIAFQKGSIFDPVWHPNGDTLLFSSDHTGVINLFELDISTNRLTQITNSRYNALEGSYHPRGDTIAFTAQYQEFQKLVVLKRSDFYDKTVPSHLWQNASGVDKHINGAQLGTSGDVDTSGWANGTYKAGISWLKPRTVLPVFNPEVDVYGLSFTGADRLQRHTYETAFTFGNGRPWYDIKYQYSGFFPGFEASVFDRVNNEVTLFTQSGPRDFILAEQGASLAVPIPITLKQNIYNRSLFFQPEITYRSVDLRDDDTGSIVEEDFIKSSNLELFSVLNWDTQQNIRDMQPNTGWSFFTETDLDLFDSGSAQTDFGYRFRVGTYRYVSPLRMLNQSLRIGMQYFRVRNQFLFDDDLIIGGFENDPVARLNEGLTFETRYLIPFAYPDNGNFGIPAFFDAFYISLFSNTVFDLNSSSNSINDFFDDSRSIFGFGLRTRMKFSNLAIDFGVGIAFEPTRNNVQAVGNF